MLANQGDGITFHLNPASSLRGVLDYSDKDAKKIYHSAITSLYPKDDLYQCEPGEMEIFLKARQNRANEYGWDDEVNGILHIPEDHTQEDSNTNYLLKEYGTISLERIARFERSYLGKEVRPAQDSYMMYQCLLNSMSKEAKIKVQVWESEYIVMNDEGTFVPSGNLLLKVIIRESHLDTNATTQAIRTKLSNLDLYIQTINCDITKFNGYVKQLIMSLSARGHRTEDLLSNLFKGYLAASDKVFIKYINHKMEKYEEGEEILPDKLMQLADNKFRLMKEKGIWNAPSEEEEKILALQAEVQQLKRAGSRTKREPANKSGAKLKNRRGASKDKSASNPNAKPDWMLTKPLAKNIAKSREWKGRKWWWCGKESGGKCEPAQWRAHNPKDCRGTMKRNLPDKDQQEKEGNQETSFQKKMKLSNALSVIAGTNDNDSTDTEPSEYSSE